MQRDPNFKKNMKRFHGVPSAATRSNAGPKSTANKLDAFIAKWLDWGDYKNKRQVIEEL